MILEKQGMTTQQLLLVDSEFNKKHKSKTTAFVLWFFLGSLGGHRFYMGDIPYALGMIVGWVISWFCFFIPIAIWVIIDAFFISRRIDKVNEGIERDIILLVKNSSPAAGANPIA